MSGVLLRRAAIFAAVAGLGLLLAWMTGGGRGRPRRPGNPVPVVEVPAGTEIQGQGGISGITLVEAEGLLVSPVQEIVLDDGSRVPFRSMVLRGASERPLPSPRAGVRRVAVTGPVLQLLPVPRTRKELEAAATAPPTVLTAPEGILDGGPGEALLLHLKGGVKVRSVRDGTPWDFAAEEAESDVQARTLRAPGAVSLRSRELRVEGSGLDAAEAGRALSLSGGAKGSVSSSRGVRLAGGAQGGETRFGCRGPFRLLPRDGPPGADPRVERWRIVLLEDAVVEQDDGSLSARLVEVDFSRPKGKDGAAVVEEVRAEGDVVLAGRGEGREFRATGGTLRARPQAKGATDAWLDGSPAVLVRETAGGAEVRTLDVRGDGTARFSFPDGDGPVAASFRGGAAATVLEPPAAPGGEPRRRRLQATTLHLAGLRAGGGPARVESVTADGAAILRDGDRSAQAKRIEFRPGEGGASRALLEGDVLFSWPAAGAMDPVAALAPGEDGAPSSPGTMLLSTPGRAEIDLPPEGDDGRGARFSVTGGAVLRRVAGEQEVYRLSCASVEASTPPGSRGIERLSAAGAVRLGGREERPGGRRYDLRGEGLEVLGAPGSREAGTAVVTGVPGKAPASAAFTGEDGRPFSVAGDSLQFDRATGAFRAEGSVRASGVLPEEHGAGPLPAGSGGAAELACEALDGLLARGSPGAAAEGATRILSLEARGGAWVKTETEYASGERLSYDAEKGTVLLRGDPARVTARARAAASPRGLEDRCESPELLLSFRDGSLLEARAEGGGLLVRHRAPEASAGKDAVPAERLQARCSGPLSYRPGETVLRGDVALARAALKDGEFVEEERVEGADEVRVLHPPAARGPGRLARAVATSAGGRIEASSWPGGWRASGVARFDLDASSGLVVLESSRAAPRFRVESREAVQSYRRAVYDSRRGIFTELVGATIEGGGRDGR